jgi:hypothetical protein
METPETHSLLKRRTWFDSHHEESAPRRSRNHRGTASKWTPILLLFSLGVSQTVGATEWQFIGARYQGMGGAGVAVVDDSLALYWNPGALAFTKGWDVQLPLGASVSAEGDVMLEIDRLDSFARDLKTIRRKVGNGEPLSSTDRATLLQLVARDIPLFREDDEAFLPRANAVLTGRRGRFAIGLIGDGDSVIAPFVDEVDFGLSGASTPDARISDFVGAGSDHSSELSGTGQSLADAIADDFRAFTSTGLEQDQAEEFVFQAESAGLDTSRGRVREGLQRAAGTTVRSSSDLVSENVTGAAAVTLVTAETTLAYGHPFFDKIGIGGAIRYIYGNTFVDYTTFYEVDSVRELIKETLEFNNRADDHEFGIDLGVLVKPVEWFRIGVVARNLNEPDFKVDLPTPLRQRLKDAGISLNDYELERQARMGAAVDVRPWWTVALDVDLTKNTNKYVPGFESRLLSMGTEVRGSYREFGVALRGGAFMNLGNNQNRAPVLTAGVGLRAWNFTLEFAGGVSTEWDRFESIGTDDRIPVRVSFAAQLGYRVGF